MNIALSSNPYWERMEASFHEKAMEKDYTAFSRTWYDATGLDLSTATYTSSFVHKGDAKNHEGIWIYDDGIGFLNFRESNKSTVILAYAVTQDRAQEILEELRVLSPEMKIKKQSGVVPVRFWNAANNGGTNRLKKLEVPTWKKIEANYTATTREKLDVMMQKSFRPSNGQLALWHGEPGTGKTTALRALAKQWESWTEFNYVLDPEKLFDKPDYMFELMDRNVKPWSVIILEDCGELIGTDAKQQTGQGMARLLNMMDGMVGQGSKTIILITTNEPLTKIHPAMKRPGRCFANVEFGALQGDEIKQWLKAHHLADELAQKEMTVAETYSLLGSPIETIKPAKPLGFAIS